MTLVQKKWPKLQQMYKKGEPGLVEQRSFVGCKYGTWREKSSKWRCSTRPASWWNQGLKVGIGVLQIFVHQLLGWNIWKSSICPFLWILFQNCSIFTFRRPSVRPQRWHPTLSPLYDLSDHINQIFSESLWHLLSTDPPTPWWQRQRQRQRQND